jgi:hypothetical protein
MTSRIVKCPAGLNVASEYRSSSTGIRLEHFPAAHETHLHAVQRPFLIQTKLISALYDRV